jgi:lipopolysaccharide transport system ATP-binding protein
MPLSGEDLEIALAYRTEDGRPTANVSFSASIYTMLGELILHCQSDMAGGSFGPMPPQGEVRCRIPRLPLPGGRYWINVHSSAGGETLDWVQRAAELTVAEGDFYGTGRTAAESHRTVLVEQEWALAGE